MCEYDDESAYGNQSIYDMMKDRRELVGQLPAKEKAEQQAIQRDTQQKLFPKTSGWKVVQAEKVKTIRSNQPERSIYKDIYLQEKNELGYDDLKVAMGL